MRCTPRCRSRAASQADHRRSTARLIAATSSAPSARMAAVRRPPPRARSRPCARDSRAAARRRLDRDHEAWREGIHGTLQENPGLGPQLAPQSSSRAAPASESPVGASTSVAGRRARTAAVKGPQQRALPRTRCRRRRRRPARPRRSRSSAAQAEPSPPRHRSRSPPPQHRRARPRPPRRTANAATARGHRRPDARRQIRQGAAPLGRAQQGLGSAAAVRVLSAASSPARPMAKPLPASPSSAPQPSTFANRSPRRATPMVPVPAATTAPSRSPRAPSSEVAVARDRQAPEGEPAQQLAHAPQLLLGSGLEAGQPHAGGRRRGRERPEPGDRKAK